MKILKETINSFVSKIQEKIIIELVELFVKAV